MPTLSFIIRIYKRNSFTIMQFFYVDSNDYSKDQDGLFQMCYDEVVAEAKDTGDFPMYSENCLVQSAKWKMEDLLASV
jgi:hypothetical protein